MHFNEIVECYKYSEDMYGGDETNNILVEYLSKRIKRTLVCIS